MDNAGAIGTVNRRKTNSQITDQMLRIFGLSARYPNTVNDSRYRRADEIARNELMLRFDEGRRGVRVTPLANSNG